LQVTESGSKSWSFRFMLNGRAREMGLGPLHTVDLSQAREEARQWRELCLRGIDPIEHRKAQRAENMLLANSAKALRPTSRRSGRAGRIRSTRSSGPIR
jgi:hypothetical protein